MEKDPTNAYVTTAELKSELKAGFDEFEGRLDKKLDKRFSVQAHRQTRESNRILIRHPAH